MADTDRPQAGDQLGLKNLGPLDWVGRAHDGFQQLRVNEPGLQVVANFVNMHVLVDQLDGLGPSACQINLLAPLVGWTDV